MYKTYKIKQKNMILVLILLTIFPILGFSVAVFIKVTFFPEVLGFGKFFFPSIVLSYILAFLLIKNIKPITYNIKFGKRFIEIDKIKKNGKIQTHSEFNFIQVEGIFFINTGTRVAIKLIDRHKKTILYLNVLAIYDKKMMNDFKNLLNDLIEILEINKSQKPTKVFGSKFLYYKSNITEVMQVRPKIK